MKNFSRLALCMVFAGLLSGCSSDRVDVEGKWGYRERVNAENAARIKARSSQPVPVAKPASAPAAPQSTTPCETTLWSDGCGASPHGQKAAEVPVNE